MPLFPPRGGRVVLYASLLVALCGLPAPASAAVSIYAPPEALARAAQLIVEGTVSDNRPGYDPVTGTLHTYTTIAVDAVHRGPTNLRQVVVREPGGSYAGLALVVEAVPRFRDGEHVLLFLEPAADGALRTVAEFQGKFDVKEDARGGPTAVRVLSDHGSVLQRGRQSALPSRQRFPLQKLLGLLKRVPVSSSRRVRPGAARPPNRSLLNGPPWRAVPAEYPRLRWDPGPTLTAAARVSSAGGSELAAGAPEPTVQPLFQGMDPSYPARWAKADQGTPVTVNIERVRDPLGDPAGAVAQIVRALDAWTDVPEARLTMVPGNTDDHFSAFYQSPLSHYPPRNIVLFGDPYEEISDPVNCSGTLARGGYWRGSSPMTTVNGVTHYPILKLFVVFNDGFECFLGDPDNLAEVATHELGHGIGLGHSGVPDAIMSAYAYGGRGPRLGDDDRDAAHCIYPHVLDLTQPDGGETWKAGTVHSITWSSTPEDGPDSGAVDIESSTDGGITWTPVVTATPNDGAYDWTVPDEPGTSNRVRVLRSTRTGLTSYPYPSVCSSDRSLGDFTLIARSAGTVSDGATGDPLRLVHLPGDDVTLSWGASCSADPDRYAIYEGSLDSLRQGTWDAAAMTCNAGSARIQTVHPAAGARYFLVVPLAGSLEGSPGRTSDGLARPVGPACGTREANSCS